MGRTIANVGKFMVDGLHAKHDGSGRIFRAIQRVDENDGNRKYCSVCVEPEAGQLEEVLRIDAMIGAPHIVVRPDGTAYVEGGGRDNTIETGHSIPGWVPLEDSHAD